MRHQKQGNKGTRQQNCPLVLYARPSDPDYSGTCDTQAAQYYLCLILFLSVLFILVLLDT